LFEISTDKVDAEIPAPSAGVLKEIKVAEGQTVPIQTVVALIDEAGGGVTAAPAAAPAPPPAPEKATAAKAAAAPAASAAPPPAPAPAQPSASAPAAGSPPTKPGDNGQKIRSSPLVRKLAKEHNVDLAA